MAKKVLFLPLLGAALASALLFSHPSSSQAPSGTTSANAAATDSGADSATQAAVDSLVKTVQRYGGNLGVSVVELDSGRVLASYQEHLPLNPASNMKLLTAAAALSKLSSAHRFRTGLYGKRNGNSVGNLVLRGAGDPSFSTADLRDLAAELRQSGVIRVEGDILVDQSVFDAAYIPPGFDQQPNEWAYFRAPISALSLDRNTITMKVYPTKDGDRAVVTFEPPGFVDVSGTVRTCEKGGTNDVSLALVPNGPRLTAKLGGAIPADGDRTVVTRRVDDPTLYAGYALRALLAEQGVTVSGAVKLGGENMRTVLSMHRSAPLSDLLQEMGKESDNFYAEMVFKALAGGAKRRGASSAEGAATVERYLTEIGAPQDGNVIKNGSGLFDTNRVSAATLTAVLRAAWQDPTIRHEYVSHLAVGGVDGTLRNRFRSARSKRIVRAKTGTLTSVASLSGYVLASPGKTPIAFAIVVNDVAGKVSGTRSAMDKCVESVVRRVAHGSATD